MRGTYALVTRLNEGRTIRIGKKVHTFESGYYVYVGSALNNLEKRIERHLSTQKRKHWHIDYFLDHAEVIETKTIRMSKKIECIVSQAVKQLADGEPMKGFGSSDCTCGTHLYYFFRNPLENRKFVGIFRA